MLRQLRDIWKYRELLRELFVTWLKLRHTGSLLGLLWTLLSPAVFVLTYWLVFTYVIRIELPNYAAFLIPGYLAWNFTWNAISGASDSMIESSHLISEIAFPAEILVLASVGVALFDFLVALLLYVIVAVIAGMSFTPLAGILPLIVCCHFLFTLGISFLGACGSVFFKDVPKLIGLAGLLLFFATPVFYPESAIPASIRSLYFLNPFAPFISLYHHALYFGTRVPAATMIGAIFFTVALLLAGMRVFRKFKPLFAEYS